MNTTRRYPRTLDDAFKGADYADPIRRYRSPMVERVADVVLAVIIGLALFVIVAANLSDF